MISGKTSERIISEYQQELNNYDVGKMIKVLEKAIDLPVDEEALVGIQRKYNFCISKLYDPGNQMTDEEREMHAEYFFRIEPLLKKILYLVDKAKYNELKANGKLECGSLLDNLHVLESLRTDKGYLDLTKNPDKLSGSNTQEDHILRAYKLRNVTAHEMRNWPQLQLLSNMQDVMVSALFICWKYKDIINETYEVSDINANLDVEQYISAIIKEYNEEIGKGFVFVPINWSHEPDYSRGETAEEEIDITQLMTKAKENSHILLLGGAGCGKSTSIDYLRYKNAKEWKKNGTSPIPVKICLSETNESWMSIEEAICDELGIDYEICERLLSRGGINLYLDGVNEMVSSMDIKKKIVRQIEKILKEYRNTFVLITDRENVEIKIDANLMTYYLHQMGEEDIRKYVESKNIDPEQKNALIDYAVKMAMEGVMFTPIILNYLTDYVRKNKALPEDSTELYLQYIRYLLDREYNEKKDINAAPGRLDVLLEYLAIKMNENALNFVKVMEAFAECVRRLNVTNIDSKNCLDLSLQLGILEQDGDMVRFANDEFYYSLLAKGIELGMDE